MLTIKTRLDLLTLSGPLWRASMEFLGHYQTISCWRPNLHAHSTMICLFICHIETSVNQLRDNNSHASRNIDLQSNSKSAIRSAWKGNISATNIPRASQQVGASKPIAALGNVCEIQSFLRLINFYAVFSTALHHLKDPPHRLLYPSATFWA